MAWPNYVKLPRRLPHPDVALSPDLEFDPAADVAARLLARICPMHVRQRSQTEPLIVRTLN